MMEPSRLRHVADAYVTRCLERRTPPRASELAAELEIEPHQLTREFQRLLHVTPAAYLKERQIACARRLLRKTHLLVDEVAAAAGFGTRAAFFRAFRLATGTTPGEYRAGLNRK
jgi:AraC family transcriptional regulator